MTGLSIGLPVVSPVSDSPYGLSASAEVTNIQWDFALGGIELLSGASNERPLVRQTAQYRKDQVDMTVQPGEQSTNFWWLRSQSSFHGGTGIIWEEPALDPGVLYSDPLSAVSIPARYQDSEGLNVWSPGQVSLLNSTVRISTNTASPLLMMSCQDVNGVNCWWEAGAVASNTTLWRGTMAGDTPTRTAQGYALGTSPVVSMTNDGATGYIALANGQIYSFPLAGGGAATLAWTLPGSPSNIVIKWVKQRIIAACSNGLYELITAGTTPSPFGNIPSTGWAFTSISESPSGVYVGGHSGTLSAIYFVTAGQGLQNVPVLQPPIQVAVMPPNEQVTALLVAEGSQLVIGSTTGVRIADIDTNNGSIAFGPVVVPINNGNSSLPAGTTPVYGLTNWDRFIFAACGNGMSDGTSGLSRIDMGFQVAYQRFAWAKDLRAHSAGTVRSVSQFGASGRVMFSVDGVGVFIQSASAYEPSGYLNTGNIRYHTLDPKLYKFLNFKHLPITAGTVAASIGFDGGSLVSLYTAGTSGDAVNSGDVSLPLTGPHLYCQLQFVLTAGGAGNSVSPALTSYQLKALPAQKNQRVIQLQVMIFDSMIDRLNNTVGYKGYAANIIQQLEALEEERDAVMLQDFTGTPFQARLVVIDQIEFVQTAPPEGSQGWGGYAAITTRTIT